MGRAAAFSLSMTDPDPSLAPLLRIDERLSAALAGAGGGAPAMPRIVGAFCAALGWACGSFWSRDAEVADRLICLGAWGVDTPGIAQYLSHNEGRRPLLNNAGIVGAAWLGGAPVWVADIAQDDGFRKVPIALRAGLHTALAFPVAVGSQVLGVLELYSGAVEPRDEALLAGLRLLGGQVGQYLLRAQAQQQLGESEKRFRCLAALSSDWYWEQDAQQRYIRFEGRGGTQPDADMVAAMMGRRQWEVPGLVCAGSDWEAHRATLERREPYRDFETAYRDDRGRVAHLSAHGDPTHDAHGQFTGYRGTARDISVLKQAAQRVHYLSTHDALTQLPNRAALRQLVMQALELAKRYQRRFAILLFDVDRFQRMNDGLGRDAGDALLRETGQRLRKQLRASDVVARLDGDEFAVLAHELTNPQDAEPVARKLLAAVAVPLTVQGQTYRMTACVGIALYPQDAEDEAALMQRAQLALRAAKREGPGSLRFGDATEPPREARSPA